MMYMSLKTYYELIFAMCQFHKWSLEDLEYMMPWEREVLTTMLQNQLEKEDAEKKK